MSTTQTVSRTPLRIPAPLRVFTDGEAIIHVAGTTVGAALDHLVAEYPSLRRHLFDERGEVRSFINLYHNDEDVRYLDGNDTPLGEGDSLTLVPSIAGGAFHVPSFTLPVSR